MSRQIRKSLPVFLYPRQTVSRGQMGVYDPDFSVNLFQYKTGCSSERGKIR